MFLKVEGRLSASSMFEPGILRYLSVDNPEPQATNPKPLVLNPLSVDDSGVSRFLLGLRV